MYREFITPDDQEILETFGEWPEAEEEGSARLLRLQGEEGEHILLSYDTLGRSVRVRWVNAGGVQMMDVFREGATRMSVSSTRTARSILIEFEFSECRGTLCIDASPDFRITDHLLLT